MSKSSFEKFMPPVGSKVRHKKTGDMYVVKKIDGVKIFERDVPKNPSRLAASAHHMFQEDPNADKLPPGSMARVCYEADRALCEVVQSYPRQKDWLSLRGENKAAWIEGRIQFPESQAVRLELHNAIRKVMQKLCHE